MITIHHGSGGRETQRLIGSVFLPHFKNELGDATRDAAVLPSGGQLAFTTDSFVVDPPFFRGGDVGRLAVCGTVNDLLTSGAAPRYLSAAFILETGLALTDLSRIAESMALAAEEAGVRIVTGDTKVIEGSGRVFINTAGIGELIREPVDFAEARPGDRLLVTGPLGLHHACIMSARMGIENEIASDAAPLTAIVARLSAGNIPLHGMRDVTRGGLATVLSELSEQYGLGALVHEARLPVTEAVAGLCGVLGLDPLYMAGEGVMLMAVPEESAEKAVELIRGEPHGRNAAIIGEVTEKAVVLRTKIGGSRRLTALAGESLPRIC